MGTSAVIRLGNRVQIKIENIWYNTIIERISDESCFYISSPISKQMRVLPETNNIYQVSMVSSNGLYEFDVLVLQADISDNIMLIKLQIVSEIRKLQRRNAYRVEVMIGIRIIEVRDCVEQEDAGYQDCTKTINLSELGMMFLSNKKYEEGTMLNCDIVLDKFGFDMMLRHIKARVIRCRNPEENGEQYKVGVRFEDIPVQSERTLARFVMRSQRFNQ